MPGGGGARTAWRIRIHRPRLGRQSVQNKTLKIVESKPPRNFQKPPSQKVGRMTLGPQICRFFTFVVSTLRLGNHRCGLDGLGVYLNFGSDIEAWIAIKNFGVGKLTNENAIGDILAPQIWGGTFANILPGAGVCQFWAKI